MGEENNTNIIDNGGDNGNVDNQNNGGNNSQPEKTFTQTELNAFLKTEREKSKTQILKDLGVTDFDTAKQGLQKYLADLEAQKTDLQKANEKVSEMETMTRQIQAENMKLKASMTAISAGVRAECAEDFATIAMGKMGENDDISTVINTLKENPAYSGFFGELSTQKSNSSFGTGSTPNNKPINGNNAGSYGAQLAARRLGKAAQNKS